VVAGEAPALLVTLTVTEQVVVRVGGFRNQTLRYEMLSATPQPVLATVAPVAIGRPAAGSAHSTTMIGSPPATSRRKTKPTGATGGAVTEAIVW